MVFARLRGPSRESSRAMLVIAQTEYMRFQAFAHQGTRFNRSNQKPQAVEGLMAKVLTLDEVDLEGRTVLVTIEHTNSPLDPETNVFLR